MTLFVTGTDTGVGKTHTAASLLRLARARGLRCAGMKPICCGDRRDAEILLAASSEGLSLAEVNPVWLRTPAAPMAAALAEGVVIDLEAILSQLADLQRRFDFVVVEGVGGWMVPIRRDYFVSDLAVAMKSPVILVALNRLGCLNHTMLTVRNIQHSGLDCAAVVLNTLAAGAPDFATTSNAEILNAIAGVPVLPGFAAEVTELPTEWAPFFDVRGTGILSPK